VLPSDVFGTPDVPHLGVIGSKQGYLYLLDLDHLGGRGKTDDAVLTRIGTDGGVFGHAGVWPGDGGYVYIVAAHQLRAYHYGLDGGKPTLIPAGTTTTGDLGYGSSSPVVTSSGLADGSAIVWVVAMAHPGDQNAQLRGYAAVPSGGALQLLYSVPVPLATKLSEPTVSDGLIYVAAAGTVYAIEPSGGSGLVGQPLSISAPRDGAQSATEVLAAVRDVTLEGLTADGQGFRLVDPPRTPLALKAGDRITVRVRYAAARASGAAGGLVVQTSGGSSRIALLGTAAATRSPAVDPQIRLGSWGLRRAVAM
jgi:hypothetical protein